MSEDRERLNLDFFGGVFFSLEEYNTKMLDAPRREISGEAARVRDMARKAANSNDSLTPTAILPRERATDSEEVRQLKRAIQAKDAELRDAVQKMEHLAQQLERLVDRFSSSVVADDLPMPSLSANSGPDEHQVPVSAFARDGDDDTEKVISQRNNKVQRRTAATTSQPTSLEAILAAARGGGGSGVGTKGSSASTSTDRPKYAKLIRDMK